MAEAPSRAAIVGALVTICLIWGSTWLAIKQGLETLPPLMGAALRFIVATGLVRLVMWQQHERIPRTRAYWALIGETGLLTYAVPFALIYWGESRISSALSAVLFATYPFFVALAARLRVVEERLSTPRIVGIVLGFAGVVIIFWNELGFDAHLSLFGMGAVVLSAALQAWALISMRIKGRDIHPATLTFGGLLIGMVVLTPASLLLEDTSTVVFSTGAVVSVLYLALFGTTISFVTYFWLLKHVHPVLLALTAFITPIIAVALGSFVLGEHLGPEVLSGGVLVLAGILTANLPGLREAIVRRSSNGRSVKEIL